MWTHSIAVCLYMGGYELIEHRGLPPLLREYSYLYIYRVSDSIVVRVYWPRDSDILHNESLLVPQVRINGGTYFMPHYYAIGWTGILDVLHQIALDEDIMDMARELDRMEESCG